MSTRHVKKSSDVDIAALPPCIVRNSFGHSVARDSPSYLMPCLTPACETSELRPRSNRESSSPKVLFVAAPTRKSRIPALGASLLAHVVVLSLVSMVRPSGMRHETLVLSHHKYSVRFIRLQTPAQLRHQSSPADTAQTAKLSALAARPAPLIAAGSASALETTVAHGHRQFRLPPNVRVQAAVKQTLVQMDLPPDLKVKQEMSVPTALLWTQTMPPPMRRQFIAPLLRKAVPRITQSLPSAATLTVPNLETTPGVLNIASAVPIELPHLAQPPAVASPVSHSGQEPAKEIPQIGAGNSSEPSDANIISLSATPVRGSTLLVLPPANQIAASDAGDIGSSAGAGRGAGTGSHNAAGIGSAAAASGGRGQGSIAANGTGSGSISSGASGTGNSSAGAGTWTATGSALNGGAIPGTTRIDLPKEGKYGVVVLGSAASTNYPESVGALSGKTVYTVYLKVGLRKSWILQYCLSRTGGTESNSASGVAVTAPWPFLIMRPDQWGASDPDYIIVHGGLNADGKFEQLKMVFPEELDKKELLLKSLKLWAFRPATRDGVPVSVEVLLIIPREPE